MRFRYLTFFVEFLCYVEILKGYSSLALAEIARGHSVNQDVIAAEGAIPPLVKILSGRKIKMQLKAIAAVEVLADRNAATQKEFLELSADKHILKLLKVFHYQNQCDLFKLYTYLSVDKYKIVE